MSTEVKKQGEAAPSGEADAFTNLKAEMQRKFGNIEDQLKQSNAQLQAMLQGMKKPDPKPAPKAEPSLEDLYYKDPVAYGEAIKKQAKEEIRAERDEENKMTAQQQKAVQSLYKEFPELSNDDHELTKAALAKYADLQKDYGNTPAAMKAAVAEAALELGIKPKSKRPADEDDFTLSGSGNGEGRRRKSREEEVDPRIGEVARLMGVDPEKAKARAKTRKNFIKFE